MKSGRPSHPRYLNLRGGLPMWQAPTMAGAQAMADVARADGFTVTVSPDCKVTLHNVCQPVWNRHTRTSSCRVADIWLRDAGTLAHLSSEPCAEHRAAVVA